MHCNYKITILLLVLLSLAASAKAANLPKTAELLPLETVLLIDIENFGELKTQFEKTAPYKFYNDPLMGPFMEQVKALFNKKIQGFDQNNCLKALIDTGVFPHKRAAIAIVLREHHTAGKEPPIILLAEWGQENLEKIKEALDKMMKKNIEMGGRRTDSENFQGVTIESAVDEGETPFGYCFIEDCLIASLDIETIKFVIAHTQGASSPTLAQDTEFQNIQNAAGAVKDAFVFINLRQILKNRTARDTTGRMQTAMNNIGFDNLSGCGISLNVARTAGLWCEAKGFLKIKGSKRGLFKIFDSSPGSIEIPKFVPVSSYRLNFFNLNPGTVFAELTNILNSFSPMYASFLYSPITAPGADGEPALKLKEDIIDHLGSKIVAAEGIKKPYSFGSIAIEYIFAISTSNRAALEKSLSKLHSQTVSNDPQSKKELLGHTIYVVNLGSMSLFGRGRAKPLQTPGIEQEDIPMPKLAFTVTDTHLILGLDSSVEQAVRTLHSGESAENSKWLNAAKSAGPSSILVAGFENNQMQAEYLWYVFKNAGEADKKASVSDIGPMAVLAEENFNFSLLPEFEKVKKYFGLTAWNIVNREDGFFMELKAVDFPAD